MAGQQCWCGQVHEVSGPAPFGWTIVRKGGTDTLVAYKRDTPADEAHHAADLAPFTHTTRREAIEAGKRGEYAYKR